MASADLGPFFEHAPEPALALDRRGRVRAANAAFEAAFGWPRERLVGRSIARLVPEEEAAALREALRDPRPGAGFETGLVPRQGAPRAVEWRLAPGPGGARLALLRDVTAERRLRRHRDEVERITGVGAWDLDLGTGAVAWSPVTYAIHGVGPAFDPSSADRLAFYEGADRARLRAAVEALKARGEPFDLELAFRRAGGEGRFVRVTGAAERRDGRTSRLHGTVCDVTEARRDRHLIERLSVFARTTSSAVVVTDRETRVEWINEAFTAQTGYAPEEVIGRRIDMLYAPGNDPSALMALKLAHRTGLAHRAEFLNRRRDGSEFRVELDLQPLHDRDGAHTGWIALRTDVTRRRQDEARLARAEREARERREQLLTAVEVLDDGFALFDAEDRLVVCNERYRQLYAESAHAIAPGARFEAILRAGLAGGHYLDAIGREEAWLAERLAAHRSAEGTVEQALPGDRWLRVHERATPDGGRVGLCVDITALRREQRAAEAARRSAEDASEAKSRFLATMSHEIRTPLNGILGLADLLAETARDAAQARMIADIRESGEGLLAILNDILDFSKIEAGGMAIEAIAFCPAELGRRVEALHAPLARERGLDLRVATGAGPARLGDPTRLLQVLNNLVSNALKFTPSGGVEVAIENPPGGPLALAVRDTGIGMSEAEAARVFERFAQADGSVTRRFGGTGLGLSIVRGLVEAMGGRVGIESAPGRGTRISAEIPLPAAALVRAAPGAGPRADLAGLRVLAADDHRMNRRVIEGLLDRLGARATVVGSGAEAVAAARLGRFDLLLLDIAMPDMDGVEALARVRDAERAAGRAPVPALAVTANVLQEQVAGYLACGFQGHLAKPLRLGALARAGRAALEPAPAAPPGEAREPPPAKAS